MTAAKDAKTQFASAMWVWIINQLPSNLTSKDDSNDDNLDACFGKNSKILGQCILDCKNDSDCETDCVSSFKEEHSECPCQVYGTDRDIFNTIS